MTLGCATTTKVWVVSERTDGALVGYRMGNTKDADEDFDKEMSQIVAKQCASNRYKVSGYYPIYGEYSYSSLSCLPRYEQERQKVIPECLEKKNAEACYDVYRSFSDEFGMEKGFLEGKSYIAKSCALDFEPACAKLAVSEKGKEDWKKHDEILEKSCNKNNGVSCFVSGGSLLYREIERAKGSVNPIRWREVFDTQNSRKGLDLLLKSCALNVERACEKWVFYQGLIKANDKYYVPSRK
jgi:hypothetical protein